MSFFPDTADPDAPFSERLLVCEGECNPDIREFDAAVAQVVPHHHTAREQRMMNNVIVDWVRRLVHTPHIPETAGMVYANGGWGRHWRCTKCGTRRFY